MALKFLRKKTTKLKSFLREYSISLYLSPCPFIINMYGIAFETDEYYIFAQEYALAGDLFDIIPPQVRAASQICRSCLFCSYKAGFLYIYDQPKLKSNRGICSKDYSD